MEIPAHSLPILKDHNPSQELGHTLGFEKKNGQLLARGTFSAVNEERDRVVASGKNGFPWQASVRGPFSERVEIIRSIRYVDAVIKQDSMDNFDAWKKLKFDLMFKGDDWYRTEKWEQIEKEFTQVGVRIIYFPYTKGTSSTLLKEALLRLRTEE